MFTAGTWSLGLTPLRNLSAACTWSLGLTSLGTLSAAKRDFGMFTASTWNLGLTPLRTLSSGCTWSLGVTSLGPTSLETHSATARNRSSSPSRWARSKVSSKPRVLPARSCSICSQKVAASVSIPSIVRLRLDFSASIVSWTTLASCTCKHISWRAQICTAHMDRHHNE